jgi:hypothetical protein
VAEECGEARRQALFGALRRRWCAATSIDPTWSPANPALGQCAITALIVQEHLGGELARAVVGPISHYWNRLPNGDIDLTREQFARFLPTRISVQRRERLLANSETRDRYELLRAAVEAELALKEHVA